MVGLEVNSEIRIGFGFELATPIRDSDRLFPIENNILAALQTFDKFQLQPRFILDAPAAFFRMKNTALIPRLMGNLPARLQHLEIVDVELSAVFEP